MAGPTVGSGLPAAAGAAQLPVLDVPRAVRLAPASWGLGPGAHPGDPGLTPNAGMPTEACAAGVSSNTQTAHSLAAGTTLLVGPGVDTAGHFAHVQVLDPRHCHALLVTCPPPNGVSPHHCISKHHYYLLQRRL